MLSEFLQKVDKFAAKAHEGQVRKYTGEPYIKHPREVAALVSLTTKDEEVIAAALLHDVVEDTDVRLGNIKTEFGIRVADLVWWLTDVSKPEDGNRKLRKEMDRVHIAQALPEAKSIKLADLINNTETIVHYDPHFAETYLREKKELLEVLKEGNKTLYDLASLIVRAYYQEQEQK